MAVVYKQKYFSTEYKELIKAAVMSIADLNIQHKLKTSFKNVLTNASLSKERREAKICTGLFKTAEYLRKNGATEVADYLNTKLPEINNLSLEVRSANVVAAYAAQSKTFESTAIMPSIAQQPREFMVESLANSKNSMLLSFNKNRSKRPSFTEMVIMSVTECRTPEVVSSTAIPPLVKLPSYA